MADVSIDHKEIDESTGLQRRDFVRSVAAGFAVAGTASAAMKVVETEVEIKTPDGTCDAAFIHPGFRLPPWRSALARCFWLAAIHA